MCRLLFTFYSFALVALTARIIMAGDDSPRLPFTPTFFRVPIASVEEVQAIACNPAYAVRMTDVVFVAGVLHWPRGVMQTALHVSLGGLLLAHTRRAGRALLRGPLGAAVGVLVLLTATALLPVGQYAMHTRWQVGSCASKPQVTWQMQVLQVHMTFMGLHELRVAPYAAPGRGLLLSRLWAAVRSALVLAALFLHPGFFPSSRPALQHPLHLAGIALFVVADTALTRRRLARAARVKAD